MRGVRPHYPRGPQARTLGCLLLAALSVGAAQAQNAPDAAGKIRLSGSLRSRVEGWKWFRAAQSESGYTFIGNLLRLSAAQRTRPRDWQIELAVPWLIDLPANSQAPAPQGPLGLGAIYRSANGKQAASLFLKQGYVRFHDVGARGNALRLGRFEFADGSEVAPKDSTLAALKRDRIAQRLLGPFGFTHVQRSFDGLQLTRDTPALNLTLLAARPTRGAFDLDGWDELDAEVYYASATHPMAGPAEGRLFWLSYLDHRDAVKVDNRPAAARAVDTQSIAVHTVGGHYLRAFPGGSGTADLLLWGAAQFGDWGTLTHHAGALAAEVGFQPKGCPLNPWFRGGINWSSGDGNPSDGSHDTFFQVLPTARLYARFPFYNLMNTTDLFLSAALRRPKWSLRADYHNLRLSRRADLWYQGGGAFQDSPSFGYVGRPSGGHAGLADVYDISLDYKLAPKTSLGLYLGEAVGHDVVRSIYPAGRHARFAYLELNQSF